MILSSCEHFNLRFYPATPTWKVINGCYIHFSTKTFYLSLQGDIFSVGIYIFAWHMLSTSFVVERYYNWRIRQLSSQCGSGLGIVLLWGRLVGNTLNDHNKLARKVVVIVVSWIINGCQKDLTKLFNIFSPFAKQNQAEVWPRFQSLLKLLLSTKSFESKYSMPLVRCSFGNIFHLSNWQQQQHSILEPWRKSIQVHLFSIQGSVV